MQKAHFQKNQESKDLLKYYPLENREDKTKYILKFV